MNFSEWHNLHFVMGTAVRPEGSPVSVWNEARNRIPYISNVVYKLLDTSEKFLESIVGTWPMPTKPWGLIEVGWCTEGSRTRT